MTNRVLQHGIGRMSFLRTEEKLLVAEVVDSERFFCSLSLADLAGIVGRKVSTSLWDPQRLLASADHDIRYLDRQGIGTLGYWSPAYPPQLREIYDPPFLLFLRGVAPDWNKASCAVVGTRGASESGLRAAYLLGKDLAEADVPVVSGLARGIDGAAHRGCVDAAGSTLAVFGCGIDQVYPSSHRRLAERILDSGGCFLSEFPPGTPPTRYTFPQRNRIITGLARGLVIVEAPARSGALISADYAMDQGRDVYVHAVGAGSGDGPGGVSEGTASLVEDGAVVIERAGDILREWGILREPIETPAQTAIRSAKRGPVASGDIGAALARQLREELNLS